MQSNPNFVIVCFQLGINEMGIQKALLDWAQDHQPKGKLHIIYITICQIRTPGSGVSLHGTLLCHVTS